MLKHDSMKVYDSITYWGIISAFTALAYSYIQLKRSLENAIL